MFEILIVDDEPMVIHGLCKQIDWESYSLVLAGTAETAENALQIIRSRHIDILFTDIRMPKMDGLQLIAAAKQQNPETRCVVISSHNEFNYVKKALLLGVENFLLKPIDQNELNQTLEKIIDNLKRDSALQNKNGMNPPDFRVNILDRWVHNDISDYEFFERAAMLDINLSAENYQICILDTVDIENPEQKAIRSKTMIEKCRSEIPDGIEAECFVDRSNRISIILYGNNLNEKQNKIKFCLDKMTEYSSHKGWRSFASVSPVSQGVEGIARLYADAVEFMNYRFIHPESNHVFSEDSLRTFDELACGPMLALLEKSMIEEDYDKSTRITSRLMVLYSNASLKSVKDSLVPFLNMIIRRIIESGNASEKLPGIDGMGFEGINPIDTVEECRQWLDNIMSQSFEVMKKRKTTLHLLVQRTLEIINRNYHADMSLKTISADFKLSPAYLGQLFRDATGKYFNNYLTEVRLNASRVLLLETDLKIMEILYRIGISNQSYFNRIFKKKYGMSPLEYRYQGKNSNREDNRKQETFGHAPVAYTMEIL
jgi:two-component system response regulator YesN